MLISYEISVGIFGMKNCIENVTARLSNFTFGPPVNVFFASIELKIDHKRSFFLMKIVGLMVSWLKQQFKSFGQTVFKKIIQINLKSQQKY